jgi:hypothetical protein
MEFSLAIPMIRPYLALKEPGFHDGKHACHNRYRPVC